MSLMNLFGRRRHERAGFALYTAAVAAARDPWAFEALDVPDTLDGRFDMVGMQVFLVVHRLHTEGKAGKDLAQAVFDAMFADMDTNLRELGVGDMTVAKKVKAMWEAFHGRSTAYAAAIDSGDTAGLASALERNVWRMEAPPGAPAELARAMLDQARILAAKPLTDFLAGRVMLHPVRRAA